MRRRGGRYEGLTVDRAREVLLVSDLTNSTRLATYKLWIRYCNPWGLANRLTSYA